MKVMITGHRPERLAGKEAALRAWICSSLTILSSRDAELECITGCAKGVDTIFADVVMTNKLPLICAFPYKHNLSQVEQEMHDYAKTVHWQTEEWYKACYLDRDRWMVDNSDVVLVAWDGQPGGGTYYTMEYAKKQKKEIMLFPWNVEEDKLFHPFLEY